MPHFIALGHARLLRYLGRSGGYPRPLLCVCVTPSATKRVLCPRVAGVPPVGVAQAAVALYAGDPGRLDDKAHLWSDFAGIVGIVR